MSVVSEMQRLNNLKLLLRYNYIFIVLFLLAIIYVFIFTIIIKYESHYTGSERELKGIIKEYSINGSKLQMTIKANEDIIATYYINSEEEKSELLKTVGIGKSIYLSGSMNSPSNNTIPNNFNYKKYLYNQKIFYLFDVSNLEINNDSNLFDKIKDYLYKRAYNLDNSAYLLVLVLGDKSLISSDTYNNYQTNGTSHLLAISGSHITVLLSIFSLILKKVRAIPKLLILSSILLFFAFITNFQAAVMRAILFFILSSINKIGKFNYNNIHILFFTAFILILINPFIVYDLGFIYSFTVCGGIIYYSDKITGNYITQLFKISLISFLFSLPISAYINYEVNIASIFVNMIFVPWISIILFPFSIITFIFPIFNTILSYMLSITDFLNNLFVKYSLFINLPKTSIIVIIILFLFLILLKTNKKYIILFLTTIFLIKITPKLDSNYYVYFLDINQGDNIVLITPHQKEAVMIDTGGKITYEVEEWKKSNKSYNLSDNPIKFLKSIGITKLDYLILTHGDNDHAGEAINILDKMNVESVVLNNDSFNDLEKSIISSLDKLKINYYQNIESISISNTKVYFLNNSLYDNENDNSIVTYTNFGGMNFLFMGDASAKVEEDLLKKYNLKNVDVLKVGHHGSKTSSSWTFVNELHPIYSIISVGKNNRYGHPNTEVLDILKNTNIYRTDEDGTIVFKIKNNKFNIDTFAP